MRKSACRWVSAAYAMLSPRRSAGSAQGAQIPARVHRQGASVSQVDEVGAVAQPLVDQRCEVIVCEAHQVLLVSR
ncbi:hypothetical protein [Streptomyces sp. NPDC048825]|uniref:hypothetical protein n=1 Tax=Streptomyces sp. NPDC048825 TaxID=3365592 RepID=UPI00371B14E0